MYLYGSSLSEYVGHDGNSDEEEIQKRVFARENLSCKSNIEIPYYSAQGYKPICVYCGTDGTKRTLHISDVNYPKCIQCGAREDIPRRKRKNITSDELQKKKKKK